MGTVVAVGKVNISALLPCCGIVCCEGVTSINSDRAVLVVGEGAQLPEGMSVFAAIVDADASVQLDALHGIAVITCGLSGRNTVSITSRTADRITLSLNRAIHTQRGLCEPMELPVPLREGCLDFDYMAAFAAAVVFGDPVWSISEQSDF